MKRRRIMASMAISLVAAFGVAACSSSGNSSSSTGSTSSGSGTFNAGETSIVNPSSAKGGTLTFDDSSTPDSFDPGNTYYAWVLNFDRLFAMPMFTYKSCPGTCGLTLVPDLATDMGKTSNGGKTWTFHIQPDVKFEDGSTVTSADVKYAIERTYDRSVMANGPSYYQALLTDPKYPGPYKDKSANKLGLTAVETPNATTLVMHLQAPFPDLPYVLAFPNSAPVPPSADKGANYQLHPLSTGPYKFSSYSLNKQLVLVPNPQWKASTDPQAKQLASKIVVNLNVSQADIDNRLVAGDIDVDAAGTGVAAAAQAKILANPTLKADADNPFTGFAFFTYLDTQAAPMNNLHCREAVEYAVNKVTAEDAYGGPYAGGQVASTVVPPNVIGYSKFDLYGSLTKPTGNATAAKAQLQQCGKASGFSTTLAYRSDRPKETAGATALQASLGQVGIKLTLKGFPSGSYYTNFAGDPSYMHSHNISMAMGGWGADWPNGYGFLDELGNSNAIVSTGNTNIGELKDPVVDNLFAKSSTLTGAARDAIWPQVDKEMMKQAAIVPLIYAKALLYRSPNMTNVYVQDYYGMYNYAVLGVKS